MKTAQYWKDLDDRREIWEYYETKAEQFMEDTVRITELFEGPLITSRPSKSLRITLSNKCLVQDSWRLHTSTGPLRVASEQTICECSLASWATWLLRSRSI